MDEIKEKLALCDDNRRNLILRAIENGINVDFLSQNPLLIELSKEDKRAYLEYKHLPFNNKNAVLIANNKHLTKIILGRNGISVPKGALVKNSQEALDLVKEQKLKFPLVVKPLDGTFGVGITVGIKNEKELEDACEELMRLREVTSMLRKKEFIVEEHVVGSDFRVLVLDGKVIACSNRIPSYVVGDGINSIEDLINKFNIARPSHYQIKIDHILEKNLTEQKYTLKSVPLVGEKVNLRKNANISMGGISKDVTSVISQRFQKICISAAKAIGLNFAGIDLFVEDIGSEDESQPYSILEVNGNIIGYDIHEKPVVEGKGVDVTGIILKKLFG